MSAFGSLADIAAYQRKVCLMLAGFVAARGGNDETAADNRTKTTIRPTHRGGESRSLGRRESGAFWLVTVVGSGKPCG
jgi:hypothetical protein